MTLSESGASVGVIPGRMASGYGAKHGTDPQVWTHPGMLGVYLEGINGRSSGNSGRAVYRWTKVAIV